MPSSSQSPRSQYCPTVSSHRGMPVIAVLTVALLCSLAPSAHGNSMHNHGITNIQSSLRKDTASSNTPRAFLNIQGGSTKRENSEEALVVVSGEVGLDADAMQGQDPEETDGELQGNATPPSSMSLPASTPNTHSPTGTKEAATGLASPPLRISTAQMGNEIICRDTSQLSPRQIRRKQRKERRLEMRKARREEKSHRKYARKLKNRNSLNIGRKVFHAGWGVTFALLNQLVPQKYFNPVMTFITSGTFVVECLRYRKGFGWINDIFNFVLGSTLRKHEMEGKFTGSFYYFLGVTVTAKCFPTACASLAILQLAFADPSASYFGRKTKNVYWSRIENGFFGIGRNKGVLGFLGGALVCFPINFYALSVANIHISAVKEVSTASIAAASLLLGLAGSFADLCVPSPALTMPKKICGVPMLPIHVDDNVVVPIFSGFACAKLFDYIGWGAAGVDLAKFIVM